MEEQQFEYRTGRTQPQKNGNGLVAALLICIIFLCGVISAMGLMNIRLTLLLDDARQEGPPLSFQDGDAITPTNVSHTTLMGMVLQELPGVYQQIHDLPQGLYISQVDAGSPAANLGILPGDVLLSVDGDALTTLVQVDTIKARCRSGDQLELRFSRDGQERRARMPFS